MGQRREKVRGGDTRRRKRRKVRDRRGGRNYERREK